MITLFAAALAAAAPAPTAQDGAAPPANSHAQHMADMAGRAEHKGMDCCKDCCKDMAKHEGQPAPRR